MSGKKSNSDKGLPLQTEENGDDLHNTRDLQDVDLQRMVSRTAGTAESEEEWYTITTHVVECEVHRENSSDSEHPVKEISDEENQADESGGHEIRNTTPSDGPERIQRQPLKLSNTWSLVDMPLLQKAIEGIIDEYLPKMDKALTIETSYPSGEATSTQQFSGSEEGTTGLQPAPANELMFADLLVQLLSRVDRDTAQELTTQKVFFALLQVATDCNLMLKNDESRDDDIQITRLADKDQTDEPGNVDTNKNEENCGGTSEEAT